MRGIARVATLVTNPMEAPKFPNVDKSLGPVMAGEAIYYQGSEGGACPALDAAFLRQVYGRGVCT